MAWRLAKSDTDKCVIILMAIKIKLVHFYRDSGGARIVLPASVGALILLKDAWITPGKRFLFLSNCCKKLSFWIIQGHSSQHKTSVKKKRGVLFSFYLTTTLTEIRLGLLNFRSTEDSEARRGKMDLSTEECLSTLFHRKPLLKSTMYLVKLMWNNVLFWEVWSCLYTSTSKMEANLDLIWKMEFSNFLSIFHFLEIFLTCFEKPLTHVEF